MGNTDVGGTGVGAAGGIMYSWLAVLQEDQVSKSCSNAKCQKKKKKAYEGYTALLTTETAPI